MTPETKAWIEEVKVMILAARGCENPNKLFVDICKNLVCLEIPKLIQIIEEQAKEIERLNNQSWNPIETAPKDGTPLLCYAKTESVNPFITIGWYEDHRWYMIDSMSHEFGFRATQPSHWIPLPKAPKENP